MKRAALLLIALLGAGALPHPAAAQTRRPPSLLLLGYANHDLTLYPDRLDGLLIGIAFPINRLLQVTLRANYFRSRRDGGLGGDLALQGGPSIGLVDLRGFAGVSLWGPYRLEEEDDPVAVSTVVGVQAIYWPIPHIGVFAEAVRRGLVDRRLDHGSSLAAGIAVRL